MYSVRLCLLAAICLTPVAATSIPLAFEQRTPARFVIGPVRFGPATVTLAGVTLRFLQASPGTQLESIGTSSPATYIHANGRHTFPQFPKLAMRRLYPGIDAVFYGNDGRLEYDLILAPGASPSRLRLSF